MLLKGASLLAMKVTNLKARPMTDADILIAPDDRARALKVLLAAVSKHPIPVTRYPLIHSLDLSFHADGSGLDLHWYALWDNRQPGADRAFVEGACLYRSFRPLHEGSTIPICCCIFSLMGDIYRVFRHAAGWLMW